MTLLGRDIPEVDALITDRYLDALLASGELAGRLGEPFAGADRGRGQGRGRAAGRGGPSLDEAVRLASARLTRDLPRFHPSFRFEERLAVRLAEAAAAMRLPVAAGAEGSTAVIPIRGGILETPFDPLADPDPEGDPGDLVDLGTLSRPLLIRGAVAASALSLAGAALVAWRRNRSGSPMARAARAAHALRGRPA